MSYNIDRYDLNTLSGCAMSNASFWNQYLGNVLDSFNELAGNQDFTGDGADAIKAYAQYVHVFALQAINLALSEFMGKIVTYAEGFSQYDGDDEAKLNYDCFTWVTNKLDEIATHIRDTTPEGQKWIDYVSDIVPDHNLQSADDYASPMETESAKIKKLRDDIAEYDATFSGDTLANVKALIADARKLIDKVNNDGVVAIDSQYIASFFTEKSLNDMLEHFNSAIDYVQTNQDKIDKGAEYLARVFDDRQRRAEEQARQARIEKGIILIGGAVIGTVLTIVTCGAAAPGVASYITVGIGTLVIANNVADFAQGVQEIYLGANNDFTTEAFHGVRDNAFFQGNEDAYEVYTIILNGSMATMGSINAIQTAGTGALETGASVEIAKLSAAGEEVFKTYAGIAVDATAEKVSESLAGDDELMKFIINQTISVSGNQFLEHAAGPAVGNHIEGALNNHFGDSFAPSTSTTAKTPDLSSGDLSKLDTDVQVNTNVKVDTDGTKYVVPNELDTKVEVPAGNKVEADGTKYVVPNELDTKVEVPAGNRAEADGTKYVVPNELDTKVEVPAGNRAEADGTKYVVPNELDTKVEVPAGNRTEADGTKYVVTDGKESGIPKELDTKVEVPADVASGAAAVEIAKEEVFTSKEVRHLSWDAVKGPKNSDMVFLGKHDDGTGGKPYDELAKDYGAQYFELESWDDLAETHSEDEMWRINEEFLTMQVSSGREIYLTSDPKKWAKTDTGFGREVRFLLENGFTFKKEGNMWHAIPH